MDTWDAVADERRRLLELLAELTEEQWDAPSLCEAWRVRDVACHVVQTTQMRMGSMLAGLPRHRFDVNRLMAASARRAGDAPVAAILGSFKTCIDSRQKLVMLKPESMLIDATLHTRDIAWPLGVQVSSPPEQVAAVCAELVRTPFFHAKRRLSGLRVEATDAPWSHGSDGPLVQGPADAIAMVLGGRRAGLERLSGDGLPRLAATFG